MGRTSEVGYGCLDRSTFGETRESSVGGKRTGECRLCLPPGRLSPPKDAASVSTVVGAYYTHAHWWAPGFEVPFSVPRVTVTPLLECAGRYRVEHGYVHIDISPRFLTHPSLLWQSWLMRPATTSSISQGLVSETLGLTSPRPIWRCSSAVSARSSFRVTPACIAHRTDGGRRISPT